MKTFELRFGPVIVYSNDVSELVEPSQTIEIQGEAAVVEVTGGADYLRINDDKGKMLFICNMAQLSFCRQVVNPVGKLLHVHAEGA